MRSQGFTCSKRWHNTKGWNWATPGVVGNTKMMPLWRGLVSSPRGGVGLAPILPLGVESDCEQQVMLLCVFRSEPNQQYICDDSLGQ